MNPYKSLKKILAILSTGLFAICTVEAETVFSSIGNSGSDSRIWESSKAVAFTVGAGSNYTLDSVDLSIGDLGASASSVMSVAIYSDDGTGAPIGDLLLTLTNPDTPLANSINTFSAESELTLIANSTYWVVAVGEDNGADPAYSWYWQGSSTAPTIGIIAGALFADNTVSPGDWTNSSSVTNAMRINATAIPEPAALTLILGLFGVGHIATRRRR